MATQGAVLMVPPLPMERCALPHRRRTCSRPDCRLLRCRVNRQIGKPNNEKVHSMLYTIAVVLLILWVLGLVTSYSLGGFIHVLLVVAVIMVLFSLLRGRRAL